MLAMYSYLANLSPLKRMINLLHRYILKQVFLASLGAVSFFIVVLVVGDALRDVLQQLINNQVSWNGFFQLLILIIPGVIPYALPMGFLLGILLVLGRLSSQHEITAIKAAGINLYTLICSILFLTFAGTVLSVLINLYYAPLADTAYKNGIVNAIRHDPLRFIKPHTFIKTFPGYVIYTEGQEKQQLKDIWLWEMDKNNHVSTFIKARKGAFSYDEAQEAILLKLINGSGERRSSHKNLGEYDSQNPSITFKELSLSLSLDKILGKKRVDRKLAFYTFGELLQERKNLIETYENDPSEENYKNKIQIQLEIQKKFAMAFSIFSLVAIAIPLGIKTSRSETSANLALALGLALSYYLLLVVLSWLQKQPHLRPDLLVWIPNLLFQAVGIYWIYRVNKR